jgi:hypothetical protein
MVNPGGKGLISLIHIGGQKKKCCKLLKLAAFHCGRSKTLAYQKTQKQIVSNGSITGINATKIENYSLFSIFITQSITITLEEPFLSEISSPSLDPYFGGKHYLCPENKREAIYILG